MNRRGFLKFLAGAAAAALPVSMVDWLPQGETTPHGPQRSIDQITREALRVLHKKGGFVSSLNQNPLLEKHLHETKRNVPLTFRRRRDA